MSDAIVVALVREDGSEVATATIRARHLLPVDTRDGPRVYNAKAIDFGDAESNP